MALCVLTVLVKGVGYSLGVDVPWTYAAIIAVVLAVITVTVLLLRPRG